ncbi:unnamed protein product [Gongylonema pulchrum]|uniref:SLC12 domain-containing protein n=1 Tax=Gongylonema pulchrum TaxID=637853 RepID=A0A183EAN2_9BILA|nr:unnamed protein product [Gongylonema pulchrum]
MQKRERQLKEMLTYLRINANSLVMPWDHVVCYLEERQCDPPKESVDLPLLYLTSFNDLVKKHSGDAAVCLMNLPIPPKDISRSEEYLQVLRHLTDGLPPTLLVHGLSSISRSEEYLQVLRHLTDGLPPTLLVHGLSSVISTSL